MMCKIRCEKWESVFGDFIFRPAYSFGRPPGCVTEVVFDILCEWPRSEHLISYCNRDRTKFPFWSQKILR